MGKCGRRGPAATENPIDYPLGLPTSAQPGSAEKLEVLMARVQAKQSLWHPMDRRARPLGLQLFITPDVEEFDD